MNADVRNAEVIRFLPRSASRRWMCLIGIVRSVGMVGTPTEEYTFSLCYSTYNVSMRGGGIVSPLDSENDAALRKGLHMLTDEQCDELIYAIDEEMQIRDIPVTYDDIRLQIRAAIRKWYTAQHSVQATVTERYDSDGKLLERVVVYHPPAANANR